MSFGQFVEQQDQKQFDYSTLARSKWAEVLLDAKELLKISFDTENDDAVEMRDITIDQKYWNVTTCTFRCELHKAGGDWQSPICYFRCQLIEGYAAIPTPTYGDKMFCFIPGPKEGNPHLTKSKIGGWTAPDNDYCDSKSKQPKPNERLCWQSLKKYLKKLVDEEIAKAKKNKF